MEDLLKIFDLNAQDALMIPIVAVVFTVFWQYLSRTVFKPYLDLLERREGATVGAEHRALEQSKKAQSLLEEFESKLFAARAVAVKAKMEEITKARGQANQILEKADADAQEKLRNVRWEIQKNGENLRKDALNQAGQLADIVVSKIKEEGRV